jgi:hypothetical protein
MTCDSGPPNICWIENTVLVLIRHCLCFLLLCHDRQPDEREERMRKLGPRSHENLVFLGTAKPLRLPSLIPKLQVYKPGRQTDHLAGRQTDRD